MGNATASPEVFTLWASGTIHEEMPNAFEAGERLKRRIIFVWPIALCAYASPPQVRNTWVAIRPRPEPGTDKPKMSTRCPVRECGKECEFDWSETRVHEVPLELFERRHFYRSELQEAGT